MQANEATFRSYLFFWSGQLVSLLGSSIAQFVIIWWITLETESALYLSLASLLGLAPMIVLAPFTGVLVDRWSRRMLIGIVDLLQALATIVLVFLFWLGNVAVWQVLVLLTLRGIFQAFHSPAVAAITPLMIPKEKLSRMNGLNYLFSGAVNLTGPIVAALLLGFWTIHQILWVDVATFIVALTPLLMIKIPSVRMKEDKSSFKEDFMEGFAFIRRSRGFLPLLTLATALNFLLTPLSTLVPYFIRFDHFGEAADYALVSASFEGGILGGGLLMSLIKGFNKKMIATTASIYVIFIGYALVALTPAGLFWFMAISALIMAFCVPVANVLTQTIFQTVVPLKMQGRVNSVVMALASGAQPIGMILSGVMVEFTRTADLFLGCSVAGILVLTFSWFFTDVKNVEKMGETSTSLHAE